MNRVLLFAIVCAACHHDPSPPRQALGATMPVDPPAPAAPLANPPSEVGDEISGTVAETMNASTYTYARLDHGGTQIWVAGPATKLTVGAKVGPLTGTLMTGFHSETLKRTFDQIYFVNTYGAPAMAGPPVPASHFTAAGPELAGTITETMDAGGYTYAQLDRGDTKLWLAGPETKLAVGTKVRGMNGTLMTGFHSDTLKRTFDQIYFVNAYNVTR